MNEVNKTLYITLYGKSEVSKKGIILKDTKAEEIWKKEGFELHGKAKSKWLAYYMGMRSAVFDDWTRSALNDNPNSTVLHIGCGMDSRFERLKPENVNWYDVDFPDVITERKKYYPETERYHMLAADVRNTEWLNFTAQSQTAVVIMEGLSMYLTNDELIRLIEDIKNRFPRIKLLVDCYTVRAAKMTKYKNPINDVGAKLVYGVDTPELIECAGVKFVKEHTMTPTKYINELNGFEKSFFKTVFGGKATQKIYRLFEFETA